MNTPVIRITRADSLRDRIADAILSGELEPDSRLDEQALAARFAVSRTPVREALKQLAAIDLVDVRPHRGAIVAELPPERLTELFEALAEVEAVCARLAAVKMSVIERERLDELDGECQAAMASGELEAVYATNKAFHDAIYAGSHNGFLVEQAFALRRRLAPLSRAQFRRTGRPHDSAREHARVMAAIRARDGAAAEESMRRHIHSVGRAFWAYAAEHELEVATR